MSCIIVPLKTSPRSHLVVHFSFSEQNLGQLHCLAVLMSEKTSQACYGLNILFLVKLKTLIYVSCRDHDISINTLYSTVHVHSSLGLKSSIVPLPPDPLT